MSIGLLHPAYGTMTRDSYLARDNHHQWPHFISYFGDIMSYSKVPHCHPVKC